MDFVIKSNIVEEGIKSQYLSVINEQPPTTTFCLDFVFLDSSDFEICFNLFLGLFPDTSILTLHNSELEVLPQVAFRLPRHTDRVLILDKVMLVANKIDERYCCSEFST